MRTLSQRNFELNEFLLTRTVRRIFSIEYLARGKLAHDRFAVSWNKRKSGRTENGEGQAKKKKKPSDWGSVAGCHYRPMSQPGTTGFMYLLIPNGCERLNWKKNNVLVFTRHKND